MAKQQAKKPIKKSTKGVPADAIFTYSVLIEHNKLKIADIKADKSLAESRKRIQVAILESEIKEFEEDIMYVVRNASKKELAYPHKPVGNLSLIETNKLINKYVKKYNEWKEREKEADE